MKKTHLPSVFAPRPLALALALAMLPLAHAAETEVPTDTNEPVVDKDEAGKVKEVTVTAERRREKAKDVPTSISTLGGEKLDVLASGGQDVRFLSGRVPSLNIESSFGRAFPRFYIRGYGNTDFRLNASQPVSLVYDDVVQENPILKGFPVFDLQQIEVLRGPQGTLFGRNSPAGVVKFDSVKPGKDREGYVNLSWGTDNTSSAEAAYNLPLSDTVAMRFSALVQHRDDWVDNTVAKSPSQHLEGYNDRAGRVQLLFKPDSTFSGLFNVHGRKLDGTARLFRANIIKKGTNDLVDGFDIDKVSIDGANEQNLTNTGASARLNWDFGSWGLSSITGYEHLDTYSRGDVDGGYGAVFAPPSGPGFIPFPSETADAVPKLKQWTQEFRIESKNKGPFNWQTGVYYFDEDYTIESFSYNSLGAGEQTEYQRSRQTNKAWAWFGSVNYALTPELKLRSGLRYTHDKKDFAVEQYSNVNGSTLQGPLSASPSANKVSGDVSGTYALTPDINLFSRLATGFRGASVQPASAFGQQSVAKPETSTSFEVGIKADLFDRRAKLSLSAYRFEVKDQQLTGVGGGNNVVRLLNAEKSVGQGLEMDLQAYVTPNLLLTMGGSYNHTEIKDPSLEVAGCGSGCTITNPIDAATGLVKINGNPLPQAPKWIGNFTLRYGIPTSDGGEYFVYTDWAYRSKVNFFLYESVEYTGKSLLEGGVRAGYKWDNGNYELALYGRNITNRQQVTGAIDFNNLTGFVNEPRMWGVQFKAVF
ncbi:TonB-dependent receptor [Chitinimonas sp.]|uniref:TonB-dependent receptor n=1 Tax=Chitinimonas sp. TaxID=1934313 RepID=UPI002F93F7DE